MKIITPESVGYIARSEAIFDEINKAIMRGGYVQYVQNVAIVDGMGKPTENKVWIKTHTILLPYISNTAFDGSVMSRLMSTATDSGWNGVDVDFSDMVSETPYVTVTLKGVGNVRIPRRHRPPVGTCMILLFQVMEPS